MASMFGQRPGGLEAILQRPRPGIWQQFRRNPYVFLSRVVYERWLRCATPAQPLSDAISVVCVSDTHNSQPALPDGDILIHAGDLTQSGSFGETQAALDWLKSQPHRHKIVIAGNHDLLLDPSLDEGPRNSNKKDVGLQRAQLEWGDLTYLQDATTELQFSRWHNLWRSNIPNLCSLKQQAGVSGFVAIDAEPWGTSLTDIVEIGIAFIPPVDIEALQGPPRSLDSLQTRYPIQVCKIRVANREQGRMKRESFIFGPTHIVEPDAVHETL
ncbi:hypothetical protein diail_270 [Diaporthe ilicicola]|nr:hypothetical protein diail_270 [Diaporthe ilicicola]